MYHSNGGEKEDEAYHLLISVMNDPATLQAFRPEREIHTAADSCEYGIQGSIYQVAGDEQHVQEWVPIDHTSRSLTDRFKIQDSIQYLFTKRIKYNNKISYLY